MSLRSLAVLFALLAPLAAHAHKPSDSYLSLSVEGEAVRGQWDVALRDLDHALGLDGDGDGRIVWGEVRSRAPEIAAFALAHLELRARGSSCAGEATSSGVDRHSDGTYLVLDLAFDCPAFSREIEVAYSLFAKLDPDHRGLLRLESGGAAQAAVLGGESRSRRFEVTEPDPLAALAAYLVEGVWHIWIGIDHVLFLLCLLLPTVVRGRGAQAGRSLRLSRVSGQVAKLVTGFTLAHSITLALAAWGLIELPSRWVESAIAASVVFVALHNLFPVVPAHGWRMAFGFGLIHGLGFANVLAELGLPTGALLPALLGFNLGVELGQLAIVASFLPVAYALRETSLYRRGLVPLGSIAMAMVATLWLVERWLGLELLTFL